MILPRPLLLTLLLVTLSLTWDCYNQKCRGIGSYYDTYIDCDNEYNTCNTNSSGYPICDSRYSGDGCLCYGSYYCSYYSSTGEAYCTSTSGIIGGGISTVITFAIV